MTDPTRALYASVYRGDTTWNANLDARLARLESGSLDAKSRELIFVVGHLLNENGEAARYHQKRARKHGAINDDFRLILKILDFYRGLRIFQDAQKLVGFWRSGNFPEIRKPSNGSVQEIFEEIIRTRTYIANGFRVYSADGDWLRLYLERSDNIKASPKSLDDRLVQLVSLAVTLKNHRYSNNWNDGCIQVHDEKARALGASAQDILEVVQIIEICESSATALQGKQYLDLD
ncbi:MAG: carboxymuconolactone decarboxylase family protein [Xanthobacteraceae bacterium]